MQGAVLFRHNSPFATCFLGSAFWYVAKKVLLCVGAGYNANKNHQAGKPRKK
mgnify:CR=1 FL=1